MEPFDLAKIEGLLRDFYNLTGIKTCLYDSAENERCYYPEKFSDFCATLRSDGEMDARCRACDRQGFAECKRTRRQYVYTCHAGLRECISPILYDGQIIGYIMIGQIKTHADEEFDLLAPRLPRVMYAELQEAFKTLPVISTEKLTSAARILDACAGYEYLKSLVRAAQSQIDIRLGGYIGDHLRGDLSVSALCRVFHLSYKEIYDIFREYFHATPAEYIKERRLSHACALLRETDLPVNEIARRVGIPDYNYFSKVFKRQIGCSPRAYRKKT